MLDPTVSKFLKIVQIMTCDFRLLTITFFSAERLAGQGLSSFLAVTVISHTDTRAHAQKLKEQTFRSIN